MKSLQSLLYPPALLKKNFGNKIWKVCRVSGNRQAFIEQGTGKIGIKGLQ